MYKKLHIQLTVFCCLTITGILTVMSCFYIRLAHEHITATQFGAFQQNVNYMLQALDEQSYISHSWLNRITSEYGLQISILDNGKPLMYQRNGQAELPLFAAARDTAKKEYAFSEDTARGHSYISHLEFSSKAITGDTAFFSVAFLPEDTGLLTVTSVLRPENGSAFVREAALPILLLTAAAAMLLGAASYLLTGRLIRPLVKNRQQQIDFFASASHELRSPLAVVLASLDAAGNAPEGKKPALFSTARRECGRMQRLINDMFALACLDHGSMSIHPAETQLENLVIEAYEKFLPVFSGKNIHVLFHLPDALLPPCFCDPERISQLFSILLDNAGAYTPPNGRISISLIFKRNHFTFTVSDSGPGIPDSEKDRIFQRFYRSDQSRTDKNHFGLGLGIAKEIVSLHHGKILVKDSPEGGASFQVLLPASSKHA